MFFVIYLGTLEWRNTHPHTFIIINRMSLALAQGTHMAPVVLFRLHTQTGRAIEAG